MLNTLNNKLIKKPINQIVKITKTRLKPTKEEIANTTAGSNKKQYQPQLIKK